MAEYLAKQLGVSRSELFTTAIKAYLDLKDQEKITQSLNQVYPENDSTLKKNDMEMQVSSLGKDEW